MSPTLDDIAAAHRLIDQGWVAEKPMFFVNIPSVLDPSMRVDGGKHVLSVETLYTPYSLVGGWEGSDEPQRWLRALASLLGNDFLESVERWRVMTPCSYEREFNLPAGHATSFGGSALSAMLGRQPELTRYQTPIKGLYLTGAATYPGAGVWGAAGRNAATVILRGIAGSLGGFGSRRPDRATRISSGSGDGLLGAPGEFDPAVGLAPDVLALHDRARLLVEHRAPDLGHLAQAELLHEGERVARVGDVVGDEHRASVRSTSSGVGGRIIGTSRRSSTPV